MLKSPPFVVLLVEDDSDFELLFQMEFRRSRWTRDYSLHVVRSGEEIVAYLAGRGDFADREQHPLPSLLLLDIQMPGRNGFEVLEWIRQHPELDGIPVAMHTSVRDPAAVGRAHDLGASWFLPKAESLDELKDRMKDIHGIRASLGSRPSTATIATRLRVLVVEDDADLSTTVSTCLRQRGFRVHVTRDGAEALEVLGQDPGYQVILLDLLLPRVDGWEFRRRQMGVLEIQHIPVVATTAYPERLRDRPIDAEAVLPKPFNLDRLAGTLFACCA